MHRTCHAALKSAVGQTMLARCSDFPVPFFCFENSWQCSFRLVDFGPHRLSNERANDMGFSRAPQACARKPPPYPRRGDVSLRTPGASVGIPVGRTRICRRQPLWNFYSVGSRPRQRGVSAHQTAPTAPAQPRPTVVPAILIDSDAQCAPVTRRITPQPPAPAHSTLPASPGHPQHAALPRRSSPNSRIPTAFQPVTGPNSPSRTSSPVSQ